MNMLSKEVEAYEGPQLSLPSMKPSHHGGLVPRDEGSGIRRIPTLGVRGASRGRGEGGESSSEGSLEKNHRHVQRSSLASSLMSAEADVDEERVNSPRQV
jgi:hypothetical protein